MDSQVTVVSPVSSIINFLEWMGPHPRLYRDVMDAWQTSCPRLPVWEDVNDLGFIERRHEAGVGAVVAISEKGEEYLREYRKSAE